MNLYKLSEPESTTRYVKKFLLVMKLTFVLIFAAFLQLHASSYGQSISLNRKDIPLNMLFKEIKKQTGYDFLYNRKTLLGVKSVTVNVTNMPLKQVLDKYLDETILSYSIDQRTIIIKRLDPSFLQRFITRLLAIDIHGKIVDEKGNAISGVTVQLKGKKIVLTNSQGEFNLSGVNEKAELTISYIGYKTMTIKVAEEMGVIRLQAAVSELD